MGNNPLKWCTATLSTGVILWLTYMAMNRGPSELVALAAALSAAAALMSNLIHKDK